MSPWVTESCDGGEEETTPDDRKHIRKLKRDRMYLKDLLREMGKYMKVFIIIADKLCCKLIPNDVNYSMIIIGLYFR